MKEVTKHQICLKKDEVTTEKVTTQRRDRFGEEVKDWPQKPEMLTSDE